MMRSHRGDFSKFQHRMIPFERLARPSLQVAEGFGQDGRFEAMITRTFSADHQCGRRRGLGLGARPYLRLQLGARRGRTPPSRSPIPTPSGIRCLSPEQFAVAAPGGHRAPVHWSVVERTSPRQFCLRRLRPRPVLLGDQIRQRHRLAQLLAAPGKSHRQGATTSSFGMDRDAVYCTPLRRPSGPCIR